MPEVQTLMEWNQGLFEALGGEAPTGRADLDWKRKEGSGHPPDRFGFGFATKPNNQQPRHER